MKTTILYVNWDDSSHCEMEYDGRAEFKCDHLWINAPEGFVNVAVFDDDKWLVFDDNTEAVFVATDVIILSMEK